MDEREAIKKCQNGEREAFRFLVESYQNQAVAHAVAILRNREDAADAVQEAFLDAFKALKNFDPARRFYPWFYVLLRHRCYKMAANNKRKIAESIDDVQLLTPRTNSSDEERINLERALFTALSEEDRELITLKHLDGLSYEELAERFNIPKGTVMSRLFYARKQLQARLSAKFK